ncbi:MAG: class I tRNA ligase family protein [Thalassobaculum sp.]
MINIFDAHAPPERAGAGKVSGHGAFRRPQGGGRRHGGSSGCSRRSSRHRRSRCPMATVGGVPLEPWLTDQWFADAEDPGEAGHRGGGDRQDQSSSRSNWEKTYFEWMRNIQPWCISRQLWWGHQIPGLVRPRR